MDVRYCITTDDSTHVLLKNDESRVFVWNPEKRTWVRNDSNIGYFLGFDSKHEIDKSTAEEIMSVKGVEAKNKVVDKILSARYA